MKVKIIPKAFKEHFSEPKEAQGIDPIAVSSHMKDFYKEPATAYPVPPYHGQSLKQVKKADNEALAICKKMESLGFSNLLD